MRVLSHEFWVKHIKRLWRQDETYTPNILNPNNE